MSDGGKITRKTVDMDMSKVEMKEVFRLLFAGDNNIVEMFPRQVILSLRDIGKLNGLIREKLVRNRVTIGSFSAFIRYENNQVREFGDWKLFDSENWDTDSVIESMSLTWKFLFDSVVDEQPKLHSVNILIGNTPKPRLFFHALLSKDPDDMEKMDFRLVPICCQIDFVDHVLSQELLDLVSKWNKELQTPEHVFPIMKKLKANADFIHKTVKYSIPLFTSIACFGFYINLSSKYAHDAVLTAEIFRQTIIWIFSSCFFLFSSWVAAKYISLQIIQYLGKYGKFTVFEITSGDRARQTKLAAKTSNTVVKFVISSLSAIAWNVISTILAGFWLK